ncbi:MAG: methionine adenosyltransferase [Rubinisphaera brasiliensis]|uniref:S-adenosylmethionine synthase n=1 Tax=Rubinisphaera brasiliensis (strain ATCC 49424 / DSM 5305 / JCM 21570 / IAM 15109 / NBRC 103401 / IFAM 1448) TaxID=756272 RepID=F0SFZ1_RUBBR|nr:methionine adenosyltransferase [Rubinisphaera brasiliensis]ADY58280.1 methionine adenosyltransferase [Rubinisphaera brasiliensis DSM 5305]MBR9803636.1 methionine adenosyltransferase [bacterium]
MSNYIFTSEAVSMGHPDKVSDQVSDGVLDALLAQDPAARVACETLCTTDFVCLAGEITANADVDYEAITREVIADIGYTSDDIGFNAATCEVDVRLHSQSQDIAMGVDRDGAGDQGLMFGYACNQTEEFMPVPIALSHRILNRLTEARQNGEVNWLRPDSKSQVSVEFAGNRPVGISAVVVSTQHTPSVKQDEISSFITEKIVKDVVPHDFLTDKTKFHINPTGQFIIGGPHGDCGLTGRKIIVDTYGGWGRHGGGAFSGKDSTKVDRSAAYMARYVAKNIVAAGLADECEVQLAYAIGVAEPVSVHIDTNGTGKVEGEKIAAAVREVFPLTPKGIIETLELRRPIFRKTAWGGHFGRSDADFTWEAINKAGDLRKALGMDAELPKTEFAMS